MERASARAYKWGLVLIVVVGFASSVSYYVAARYEERALFYIRSVAQSLRTSFFSERLSMASTASLQFIFPLEEGLQVLSNGNSADGPVVMVATLPCSVSLMGRHGDSEYVLQKPPESCSQDYKLLRTLRVGESSEVFFRGELAEESGVDVWFFGDEDFVLAFRELP